MTRPTTKQEGREFAYCRKYGTSASTLEMVTGIRAQLLGQLRASGFVRPKGPHDDIKDLNRNSEKWAVVKAAIVAGSYPSMARYDEQAGVLRTKKESKVRLHPRSVVLETSGQQNVRGASKLSKKAQAATLRNLPPGLATNSFFLLAFCKEITYVFVYCKSREK